MNLENEVGNVKSKYSVIYRFKYK